MKTKNNIRYIFSFKYGYQRMTNQAEHKFQVNYNKYTNKLFLKCGLCLRLIEGSNNHDLVCPWILNLGKYKVPLINPWIHSTIPTCYSFKIGNQCQCGRNCDGTRLMDVKYRWKQCFREFTSTGCHFGTNCYYLHTITPYE